MSQQKPEGLFYFSQLIPDDLVTDIIEYLMWLENEDQDWYPVGIGKILVR